MKKILDCWKLILVCIAIGSAAFTFRHVIVAAEATKEKVDKLDEAVVELKNIASQVTDPRFNIGQDLILAGYDKKLVKEWIGYPNWPPLDSTGKPRNNVLFVNSSEFPWTGCQQIFIDDSLITIDTLWKIEPPTKKE